MSIDNKNAERQSRGVICDTLSRSESNGPRNSRVRAGRRVTRPTRPGEDGSCSGRRDRTEGKIEDDRVGGGGGVDDFEVDVRGVAGDGPLDWGGGRISRGGKVLCPFRDAEHLVGC
jgi:hypothetical protein